MFHCNTSTIYNTLKRLGLQPLPQWARNASAAFEAARTKVPEVIIEKEIDRAWAASLFGGEGCIAADYMKRDGNTYLVTLLRMSDKDWVDHFAQLVGLPESGKRQRGKFKTQCDKTLAGKRAIRFLIEILPYLYGSKKKEALRAIEFFSPDGHRRGRHSSLEIWPSSEFPLRKRLLNSKPTEGRPRESPRPI